MATLQSFASSLCETGSTVQLRKRHKVFRNDLETYATRGALAKAATDSLLSTSPKTRTQRGAFPDDKHH